jgi:MFS family permease
MQTATKFPYALVLWSSAVFALQIGVARLGYGLALPAIRAALHGSYTLYGTINTASLGGYLVGALLAPLVIGRVRGIVLTSSVAGGTALALSAFATNAIFFGAARTAFGIASGISLVATSVQALEAVEPRRRGGASAIAWGGIGIGVALSAFGTGWVADGTVHWRIASFAAGVVMALAGLGYGLAARTVVGAPRIARGSEPPQFGRFVFLCASYFSFGFAYIAYATFIVASVDAGMGMRGGQATVQALWAALGLSSIAGTVVIGRILNHPMGRGAMAFCRFSSAAGCALAALSPQLVVPSAILVGLGFSATPAAATAFARARSTTASAAGAMAIVTVAVGTGQLVGPAAAGLSADHFGLGSVAIVACGVFVVQALSATVDAMARMN